MDNYLQIYLDYITDISLYLFVDYSKLKLIIHITKLSDTEIKEYFKILNHYQMHLAYSAFRAGKRSGKIQTSARYRGYLAACNKHQQTIAAIRQYIPGWEPALPVYK